MGYRDGGGAGGDCREEGWERQRGDRDKKREAEGFRLWSTDGRTNEWSVGRPTRNQPAPDARRGESEIARVQKHSAVRSGSNEDDN